VRPREARGLLRGAEDRSGAMLRTRAATPEFQRRKWHSVRDCGKVPRPLRLHSLASYGAFRQTLQNQRDGSAAQFAATAMPRSQKCQNGWCWCVSLKSAVGFLNRRPFVIAARDAYLTNVTPLRSRSQPLGPIVDREQIILTAHLEVRSRSWQSATFVPRCAPF
jgi:hypothetical protein